MADRYFDLNGATAGFGTLTGAWNTTSFFWSTSSAGIAAPAAFTFTSADRALFGFAGTAATAGTATIADGTTVTLNSIVTANLAGLQIITRTTTGALTLAGTTPTINVGSAGGLTISAPISGTDGLTKTGTNTLTLAAANTFSGDINVNSGTLSAATSVTALGSTAAGRNFTVASGATLSIGIAALNYSNTPLTINGTGVTGVNNGALFVGASSATVTFSSITLGSSALISNSASAVTFATGPSGIITSSGKDLTLAAGISFTVSGPITGAGALRVGISLNTASIFISGANTYTGNTSVEFGTLAVSGTLGNTATNIGSYAGNISIASGLQFSYANSTTGSSQTISGTISGAGTLSRGTAIVTTSLLTLLGSNTLTTVPILSNGITAVAAIESGAYLGSNSQITLGGTTTSAGAIRYTGSGETVSSKTFYLGSTSTGGGIIESSGTGPLVVSTSLSGASSPSARPFTLRGTYGNESNFSTFSGVIGTVGGGGGATTLAIGVSTAPVTNIPVQAAPWKLTNTNTYTGPLTVFAILDVTASGSISTPSSITIGGGARNASLWIPAGLSYSGVVTLTSGTWGGDYQNNPFGNIRTKTTGAAATFSGAIIPSGASAIYADQADITFTGAYTTTTADYTQPASASSVVVPVADTTIFTVGQTVAVSTGSTLTGGTYTVSSIAAGISVTLTLVTAGSVTNPSSVTSGSRIAARTINSSGVFVSRAASGRTVTMAGGLVGGSNALSVIGPGTTVVKGTNSAATAPNIFNGKLSFVADGTLATANGSFTLGALGTVNLPGARYAYTGGALELDNVGATGTISKTWGATTTVTRGPATIIVKRSAAQNLTLGLTTLNVATALATIQYNDVAGGAVIGANIAFTSTTVNGTTAATGTQAPGLIISNGTALVPAAWTTSTSYITFPVYGTTTNFTTQGASASGLTVATGTTQNVNVTGGITGQNTVAIRTIRLEDLTVSVALNSGQRLDTNLFMSMGAGTSATLITGGTLGSSGNAGTLNIYAANASGSTIASALDKRNTPLYGINGSGTLTFSGAVLFATTLQHNAANVAFSSTFALPFATFTQANPSESADAITMTLGSGAASLSILSGGGANTTLALNGGDLTLTNMTAATSYYAGAISRNSTQKLIVKMLVSAAQSLHGDLSVPLEFKKGQITIAPIYGATVTDAPTVTFSGTSTLSVDMSGSTLNNNYSLTFGALAANAGFATVNLQTSTNGYYTNTLTFASLSRSSAAAINFSATSNSLNLTVFSTPPTLTNNIIGPWAYTGTSGFALYRSASATFTNGGTVPTGGSVDYLNYGVDANTLAAPAGTVITGTYDATTNVYVTIAGAITAQTNASAYTLRLGADFTVASGNLFKTNAILSSVSAAAGADSTAALSTIDGDLYLIGGANHTIKIVNNPSPAQATRVVLVGGSNISSTASTYTGGTVVYGTLAATTTDAMLGNASGGLTFDGATFAPSVNFTTSRSISIPNAGLVLSPATGITAALDGALSGDGILRFAGAGTTTISGSNTLSGFINIAAGTVSISHNAALGTTSTIDMANGTLTFASGVTSFDSSRFSSRNSATYSITNSSGTTITFSSSFGNNSSFLKTGTSDIVLAAANGITSTITVSAGALVVTDAGALGYGDASATTTINTSGALVLRGTFTLPGTATTNRTYTLGSAIGFGTYAAALWADGGVVTIPSTVQGSGSAVTSIGCADTYAVSGLILNGPLILTNTTTINAGGSGNIKVTGRISGTALSGLFKSGNYTLEIAPASGSNTYTHSSGGTSVSGGKLKLTTETPDSVYPVPLTSTIMLSAGTTIQSSTGTLQKGRITVGNLDNSAGGTIRIGG